MEVHVIRHTKVDADGVCYGFTDVALADTFEQEVSFYKQKITFDFDAIYSSPLSRCTKLTSALGFKDYKKDDRIMELNFGDWENKKWEEINAEELKHWMNDFVETSPPNGETLSQLYIRVESFLDELREKEYKKVLIVTHAGVLRCFWAYVLQLKLQQIFKIPIGFGENLIINLGKDESHDFIIQK